MKQHGLRVVTGMGFGDEGKGKLSLRMSQDGCVTARVNGGDNAGHTTFHEGRKMVFHHLPSSTPLNNTMLIGQGALINPQSLIYELAGANLNGLHPEKNLLIDYRCGLILPYHQLMDLADEWQRARLGAPIIGTTGRGIGPAYGDVAHRSAITMSDLLHQDHLERKLDYQSRRYSLMMSAMGLSEADWQGFLEKITTSKMKSHKDLLGVIIEPEALNFERFSGDRAGMVNMAAVRKFVSDLAEQIRDLRIMGDASAAAYEALRTNDIVAEIAQGNHISQVFGPQPFTTSSYTVASMASLGLGVSPLLVKSVDGVAKMILSSVGERPFYTQMSGEDIDIVTSHATDIDREVGASTGRDRRIGYLCVSMLRSSIQWSGVQSIELGKFDWLSGLKKIKVANTLRVNGTRRYFIPSDHHEYVHGSVEPEYIELDGWEEPIAGAQSWDDLPINCRKCVYALDTMINQHSVLPVRISRIGTGPGTDDFVTVPLHQKVTA